MNDKIIEKRDTSIKELQNVYPTKLLYEFSKKAVNYYVNGKQEELLGYIVGYQKENILIGTEIIFPFQENDDSWDKIDKG